MRRRELLAVTGTALAGALAGCSARSGSPLVASSPAFADGDALPVRFTCEGAGVSPPLVVESVPEPTETLAVVGRSTVSVLDNPVLWTLWNVPAETDEIPAGLPREPTVPALGGARQGRRPGRPVGYRPPCPPRDQPFDHWFQVYALDVTLSVPAGASHERALETIEGATLASSRITVTYTRERSQRPATTTGE